MANIPKKVTDRFNVMVKKYQRLLQNAKDKDINEADTVTIIANILHEVFGYDQYEEITKEFAIKNTYCDLAIKIDKEVKFLIEAKAIGTKLSENHINQATNYGANKGIEWVILTNGIHWIVYKMTYNKRIVHNQICDIDFLELNPKKASVQEQLFILCKEGLSKDAIEEFHAYKRVVNKFYISAIILSDAVQDVIKRELKKSSPGLKLDDQEVDTIMKYEVLKRDGVDSEEALDAIEQYRALTKKAAKKVVKKKPVQKSQDASEVEFGVSHGENTTI